MEGMEKNWVHGRESQQVTKSCIFSQSLAETGVEFDQEAESKAKSRSAPSFRVDGATMHASLGPEMGWGPQLGSAAPSQKDGTFPCC